MQLPKSISAAIEAGGIVITSSPRAARALRRLHGEAQRDQALTAWRAAEILHWDGWLEKLWQQEQRAGNESRLLLSQAQERRIWSRLVRPSIEGKRLISIEGVAELAREGYARLCAYQALNFLSGELFGGLDVENFRQWARSFERQCREQGWLSRSMLPLALRDAVVQRGKQLPQHIMLVGFDRITPAQRSFVDACSGAGCLVQDEDERPRVPAEALVAAANPQDEIFLCAWWAHQTLQESAAKGEKTSVAILVPDIKGTRTELGRILREVLAPDSVSVAIPERVLPFEFSLGVPLAQIPIVRVALLLLRWMNAGLRQEELTWLILSGFLWQDESDMLPLAELDAKLRQGGILPLEQEIDLYLTRPGWHSSPACKRLSDRLLAARRAWRESRREFIGFAEWAERAREILSASGWPGPHPPTSEDFQVRTKWEQLLDSVASLTLEGPPVSYTEFRQTLEREAELTIFSPESRDAAVQVLGPFESAGMEFDAVWFLGADDASWPAPARPHPFLTSGLQKQHGMPHADNNVDWELAEIVTRRIQRSTAHCIFSYAMQDKDGERRPSTVLVPKPRVISGAEMRTRFRVPGFRWEGQPEVSALRVEEESAFGISWPEGHSPGGHDVLKRQAACPFQAFAHFRLGGRELDAADWGLDPKERGNLLHNVLERIWEEVKDHDSLVKVRKSSTLLEIAERHVISALRKYHGTHAGNGSAKSEGRWNRAYLQAEQDRVVRLVVEWLAYEERRPPFTVEHREKNLTAQVGDLELRLRTDRIDQMESGRLLIDYKSGKVKSSAWEGDRPDEPQLPLYATFGNVEELRGVLFAQIRSGEIRLDGSADDASLIPGKSRFPMYTPELRQQWEKVLLSLSRQFHNGEAQVDPKHRRKTCNLCALPGLCRVAETEGDWADSEPLEEQDANGEE